MGGDDLLRYYGFQRSSGQDTPISAVNGPKICWPVSHSLKQARHKPSPNQKWAYLTSNSSRIHNTTIKPSFRFVFQWNEDKTMCDARRVSGDGTLWLKASHRNLIKVSPQRIDVERKTICQSVVDVCSLNFCHTRRKKNITPCWELWELRAEPKKNVPLNHVSG